MTNFRPISFCNVIYKLIAKAFANQFRRVLDKCIDPTQNAYIPGRLISDNVLLTYKMLHTFRKKKGGRQRLTTLKLDMSKAYDRVE